MDKILYLRDAERVIKDYFIECVNADMDADRQPPDSCPACGERKLTCSKCRYLQVINTDEVYAQCTKTGCVFRPFRLDTRKVYCDLGERKDDADG